MASGIGLAGAAALHRASLSPPVAATLLDAASLATWISTLGFALALATAGWSIIRGNHALAQWTGWSALAITAAFAACLLFARTGTGHLPAIAADLWIIATVIAVIRRRTAAPATADVRAQGSPAVVPDNRPLSMVPSAGRYFPKRISGSSEWVTRALAGGWRCRPRLR